MLLLAIGLLMTGQAVLTPLSMVILMITGDFLSMTFATDRVRPIRDPKLLQHRRDYGSGSTPLREDSSLCVSQIT